MQHQIEVVTGVPTRPPHPATPVDKHRKHIAAIAQQIHIWDDVEGQVDPLHSRLDQEQHCMALAPRMPANPMLLA